MSRQRSVLAGHRKRDIRKVGFRGHDKVIGNNYAKESLFLKFSLQLQNVSH